MSIKEDLLSVGLEDGDSFIDILDEQRFINDQKEELQQLLTVSDSLESLIKHLEGNRDLTPGHVDLLRTSCENLLRGTGYGTEILIPSLEDYSGGTVSTESLKDRLAGLWKRIVSITLSILAAAGRYWKKVSTYEGRLRMTAESLRKQGAIRRGRTIKNAQTELGIEIKSLTIGASNISDADTLIRAVSAAIDQYKLVTTSYPKAMVSVGRVYEDLYKGAGDNVRQTLEDFCCASIHLPFGTVATQLKAMAYRDTRFGPRSILMAPPTLGGWSLFINVPDDPVKGQVGNDLTTQAARIRASGMRWAMTDVNAQNGASGFMRTASGAQVEQMAARVINILDAIAAQESSRLASKINGQIKAVLSAAENYKNRPQVGSDGTLVYSESILRFARSYASWASGPVDQMTTNLLTVSRAILIYGRKSLRNQ